MINAKTFVAIALTFMFETSVAEEDKGAAKTVKDAATSVANEFGKGLKAVGKAVGPAVNKAEKAVRGGAKEESDKPDAGRK